MRFIDIDADIYWQRGFSRIGKVCSEGPGIEMGPRNPCDIGCDYSEVVITSNEPAVPPRIGLLYLST